MIDKRIFYCWFGRNKKTELQEGCISSWKEHCPDYEIIEINETNFDVNKNSYSREAYLHNNYSFTSDVARLEILKNNSGFYLDTDIRLIKSLDELREYNAFICSTGQGYYNSAPLGCSKFPKLLEDSYNELEIGNCILPILNKKIYERYDLVGDNLKVYDDIAFLGWDYFITHNNTVKENTIGIHYCVGSWLDKWNGGYNPANTFNGFEVYQDGFRDLDCEKRYFGNCEKIGKIYTYNSPFQSLYKYYGNFFFNPRVMRVRGNNFIIERYNLKETIKQFQTEGIIIECC